MRHFSSLTGTLKDVLEGNIEIEEFFATSPIGFVFSGTKVHVLGSDRNMVPYEATWANQDRIGERNEGSKIDTRPRVRPVLYAKDCGNEQLQVHYDAVDPGLHAKVALFLAIVEAADDAGHVKWEASPQVTYLAMLPDEDFVYLNQNWRPAASFRHNKTLAEVT